ncbi:MAG: GNAT family N-acetyltransferase [Pseudomonadota bacterium]
MMDWQEGPAAPPEGAAVALQQHPVFASALKRIGRRTQALSLNWEGRSVGFAQIVLRRVGPLGEVALLSRGPAFAPELECPLRRRAVTALVERLAMRKIAVIATPDPVAGADPLAAAGWLEAMTPAVLARLDLTPEPAVLRARLHGKWRNRLVAAERAGLHVTDAPFKPETARWLLTEEAAQRRARRYGGLPLSLPMAWAAAGGPRATRLFEARLEGRRVAAMLFLIHPPGASYTIGWSGPAGRDAGAHPLILWRAMLWLRARGIRDIDLGTLDTERAAGLARFKLGAGAVPETLGATRFIAPGTRAVARWFAGGAGARKQDRVWS